MASTWAQLGGAQVEPRWSPGGVQVEPSMSPSCEPKHEPTNEPRISSFHVIPTASSVLNQRESTRGEPLNGNKVGLKRWAQASGLSPG